jgi:type II secretory pathway pseudopilin PulG
MVELMITVVIVAVLGALATIGVRKYILLSKTSEATEMIAAIKVAQEAYKAETFIYKDVSKVNSLSDYSTFYPATTPLQRKKMAWGAGTDDTAKAWRELGVQAAAPVMYIYGCAAGGGNVAPAAPGITIGNYPVAATGAPWYLIKAAGDLDGNGTVGTYVGVSFTAEIFHDKQEE